MTKRPVDFGTVRTILSELGAVEESLIHGAPALKVRGKMVVCMAVHKSAEAATLLVRIAVDQREKLIASASDIYYVTDHYVKYPTVLVRLPRIQLSALRALLEMAWSFACPKPKASGSLSRKSNPNRRGAVKKPAT